MSELKLPGLRLGGTSWVVRGSFAENLRALSAECEDMQLVLFDTPFGSNIPSKQETADLAALCRELGMTCTVHFPRDICLSADLAERTRCEDYCLRMIDLFAPLQPSSWVLHLAGEQYGKFPSTDMARWQELTLGSLMRLAGAAPDRELICAETLDYDLRLAKPAIEAAGVSVCLDIGHLVRYGHNVAEQIECWGKRIRSVHIHGVKPDGMDHVDMGWFDARLFRDSVRALAEHGTTRVLTLEVFEEDYPRSLEAIKSYWNDTEDKNDA